MADRYFVDAPIEGSRARLVGNEAHHLAHVMRANPGDLVTLFDGSGAEFSAHVENVGRSEIELVVLARTAVDRELPVPLTLGVALPKGDRQRWLVEKATELGVTRLVPLVSEHSGEQQAAFAPRRLRQAVIEASKQCGRNRLMEIAPAQRLSDFLAAAPADSLRFIAEPGTKPLGDVLHAHQEIARPRQVVLAVGPEGGFTHAEVESAARHGWQAVSLGPCTLRVETAALALVSAIVTRACRTPGQ